jgi:hypothetical protein
MESEAFQYEAETSNGILTFFSFQIIYEQLLLVGQILGDEVLFCNGNHGFSCFQLF